jgi:hypothetical protein
MFGEAQVFSAVLRKWALNSSSCRVLSLIMTTLYKTQPHAQMPQSDGVPTARLKFV